MRKASMMLVALACWTGGCGSPSAPSDTALVGTVLRGPVQPVCIVNVPCDAPFAATFTVRRNDRVVTTFRSDTDGHFSVALASGAYVVVPGADAPIIAPGSQTKSVTVGADGHALGL